MGHGLSGTAPGGGAPGGEPGAILLVGRPDGPAAPIAARLRELGEHVVAAGDPVEAAAALAALGAATGPGVRAVVHADLDPRAARVQPISAHDEASWAEHAEAPVVSLLATLQAAHRHAPAGVRIVVVVPSVGVVGQAGLVPLCTAAEGMRALAKAAARTWGVDGTTVNLVAFDVTPWMSGADAAPHLAGPSLAAAATGGGAGAGDVDDGVRGSAGAGDAAAMVALLCGAGASRVTGATLFADLGRTMLP